MREMCLPCQIPVRAEQFGFANCFFCVGRDFLLRVLEAGWDTEHTAARTVFGGVFCNNIFRGWGQGCSFLFLGNGVDTEVVSHFIKVSPEFGECPVVKFFFAAFEKHDF